MFRVAKRRMISQRSNTLFGFRARLDGAAGGIAREGAVAKGDTMTTRKRRQAERIKAYGLVLNHHCCGRGIFIGADGRFFAAEARDRGRTDAAKEATMICPECGKSLQPQDFEVTEAPQSHPQGKHSTR